MTSGSTATAQVAVLIPLLARPHRVAAVCDSVRAATPQPHQIVLICSPGDRDVIAEARRTTADLLVVGWQPGPGDYARKINAAYRLTRPPWIFTGADDLAFRDRWLHAALEHAVDDHIGVIGTNDLGNARVMRGVHATHSLVARWYADLGTIDQPEAIYHEGYPHEFCDDELVGTARRRSAWAFAHDSIVEHLHPSWGKAPMDHLYEQQGARMAAGRRIYRQRARLWT